MITSVNVVFGESKYGVDPVDCPNLSEVGTTRS